MQIAKISSFGFRGINPKQAAAATKKVVKAAENPMTSFVKETKNLHEYYSPCEVVPNVKNNVDTKTDFFSPRNLIAGEEKINPADAFFPPRTLINK